MDEKLPKIRAEQNRGENLIHIEGELSYYHTELLRTALRRQLETGGKPTTVVFDLSLCPFVDSGCMGLMVEFKRELDRRNCSMRIENVSGYVEETMRRLGLNSIVSISRRTK